MNENEENNDEQLAHDQVSGILTAPDRDRREDQRKTELCPQTTGAVAMVGSYQHAAQE